MHMKISIFWSSWMKTETMKLNVKFDSYMGGLEENAGQIVICVSVSLFGTFELFEGFDYILSIFENFGKRSMYSKC